MNESDALRRYLSSVVGGETVPETIRRVGRISKLGPDWEEWINDLADKLEAFTKGDQK